MNRVRVNFIGGELDDTLDISATSFESASLAALPAIEEGLEYAVVVFDPDGENGEPEIAYIVDHTALATIATIDRSKEGTANRIHPSGTKWLHIPTAADWNDTVNLVNTDGDPGRTIYVGSVDPDLLHTLAKGDIWLRI